MVKPLGIVAMLVLLLNSGTALASDHISISHVKDMGVTTTGKLILKTKWNKELEGQLQLCPVADFVAQTNSGEMLRLYPKGTRIGENSTITFLSYNSKNKRNTPLGTCKLESLTSKIS